METIAMEELIKIVGGAAGGLALVGILWRNLNGRMNRLEEHAVDPRVCDERHRRIDEKLEEMKLDLKEIKAEIKSLPGKINGGRSS